MKSWRNPSDRDNYWIFYCPFGVLVFDDLEKRTSNSLKVDSWWFFLKSIGTNWDRMHMSNKIYRVEILKWHIHEIEVLYKYRHLRYLFKSYTLK
jgi:hypothetical protein